MKNNDIPWIEKYRPRKLDDIISQSESINILTNTLMTGELPHLLLYGGPGTGKTSSILALCNQLYGPERVNERVIELNASDERGINVVRHKIINFAKIAIGSSDKDYLCPPYKIIILDEADAMTKEAQAALRKVMEETSSITRFCFICNYINQIIEPINSRCVKIRFKPITIDNIITKLEYISKNEKIHIDRHGLTSLAEVANGDLRKSILILQNIKYIKINSTDTLIKNEDIYDMCKYISDSKLEHYMLLIKLNRNIDNIITITHDIINNGYIFNSVIIKIMNYLINSEDIPDNAKAEILFEMSSVEKNINDGADEYIQLLKILYHVSMINAFKI
ncbi:MAG: replication factor C small subunit [Gaeavirus sp.]|uniref:Replication factor C small subunit n=1 Tax=Gaeavirus sp. TaxID=2487767 RepID=A0A3G4ZYM3_9VIRU|nr:MAG: replication factor C small subunit [Gaeavirus sp.]